jgi:hypothetical protein
VAFSIDERREQRSLLRDETALCRRRVEKADSVSQNNRGMKRFMKTSALSIRNEKGEKFSYSGDNSVPV